MHLVSKKVTGNAPQHSIGARLLLYVLGIAFLALLLETSGLISWQRHLNRTAIENQKAEIQKTYLPVLKENLWLTNREQIQLLLNGIVQRPEIAQAQVRAADGTVLAAAGTPGKKDVSLFAAPLIYLYNGQEIDLGKLEIDFALAKGYGMPILASQSILILFMALSFFLLFNALVTRHLRRISKYFEQFDVQLPTDSLYLEREETESADELNALVASVNSMRSRLLSNQREHAILLQALQKSHEQLMEQVHEVQQAREDLEKSEKRNATILDRSIDSFWFVDHTGRILEVNESFSALLGYSRAELLNMTIADLEAKESTDEVASHISKIIAEGHDRFETRLCHKDGHTLEVENSVNFDSSLGNIFFCFTRDISKRKQVEEELRLQAEIMANMEEGVTLVRASDGIIVFINPKFAEMFGYAADEMVGRHISMVNAPGPRKAEDVAREIMEKLQKTGRWQGEVENVKKDGTVFWCHAKVHTFMHSELGEVLVTVHSDITAFKASLEEQARLEKQLRQAQKMQSLGTLAGGIAHEFNNFLGIIILNAEMLQDHLPSSALVATRQMERILKAGHQAKKIVNQILAFSRVSSPKRTPVILRQLLAEIMSFLETSLPSSITIVQRISAEECLVLVDADEIHQILMNLCANAVQAMQETGTLSITLEAVSLPGNYMISGFSLPGGRYARLSVSDTGVGMDRKTLESACDPFFTTKEVGKGTGMGLSLVYGIMERYQGAVHLESEAGKGTTVHLFFPIVEQKG